MCNDELKQKAQLIMASIFPSEATEAETEVVDKAFDCFGMDLLLY